MAEILGTNRAVGDGVLIVVVDFIELRRSALVVLMVVVDVVDVVVKK